MHNDLGDKGAKRLAFALEDAVHISALSLRLRYNSIGVEGTAFLAEMARMPHMKSARIDLESAVGSQGAAVLGSLGFVTHDAPATAVHNPHAWYQTETSSF